MKTREEWLNRAVTKIRPLFKEAGYPVPKKIMVGCGWPRGGKAEVIGQCFGKTWTSDETIHIFISPTQAAGVEVLAILVHELVHAAVGCEEGHRGKFKTLARKMGLEGKLTATYVSDKSPLYLVLKKISKELGKYPHSKMLAKSSGGKSGAGGKGWVRLCSRSSSEYTLVISPKSLSLYGYPLDFSGVEMIKKEAK